MSLPSKNVSSNATQNPSRANSPPTAQEVGPLPMPEVGPLPVGIAGRDRLEDENERRDLVPVPKIKDDTQLGAEGKRFFDMVIVDKSAAVGAHPKVCTSYLNSRFQELMHIETGKPPEDPFHPTLFSCNFYTRTATDGKDINTFVIGFPESLKPYALKIAMAGKIDFTGDEEGNKYKLEYREHHVRVQKQRDSGSEMTWCHLIVKPDSELPAEKFYEAANEKLKSCGLNIQEGGFFKVGGAGAEMDQQKFHVKYDIDWKAVPRKWDKAILASTNDDGPIDLSGLRNHFVVDEETGEKAKFWFKKEYLYDLFNVRECCMRADGNCICDYKSGKQRQRPAEAAAAYKRRKAKMSTKAKMNFEF